MTLDEQKEYNDFLYNEEMTKTEQKEIKAKEDSNIIVDILSDKLRKNNIEIKNIRNHLWFAKKLNIDIIVENKLVTLMFHDRFLQYKNILKYNFNRKHWDLYVKSNDLKYELVDKSFDDILKTLQKPNFKLFLSMI